MSTNSTIKIKRTDGTETAIYCHYDGYIEGVGTTLQLAYNTAEKVEELLKLGDLSTLGYYPNPKEGEEHSFEGKRQENVCVAYHRDRGEDFRQSNGMCEYIYTFDEAEAVWYVEEEHSVRDTEAQQVLCLDMFWRYKKRLLLDAIMAADYNCWCADEFADFGEVVMQCMKKALDARNEIIDKERKEYESFYRAYCD